MLSHPYLHHLDFENPQMCAPHPPPSSNRRDYPRLRLGTEILSQLLPFLGPRFYAVSHGLHDKGVWYLVDCKVSLCL